MNQTNSNRLNGNTNNTVGYLTLNAMAADRCCLLARFEMQSDAAVTRDEKNFAKFFFSVVPAGESNRRTMLKSRKLLILQIARNAKTARNVFRGYVAATRNAAEGFSFVAGIVGTQKFISVTKTN